MKTSSFPRPGFPACLAACCLSLLIALTPPAAGAALDSLDNEGRFLVRIGDRDHVAFVDRTGKVILEPPVENPDAAALAGNQPIKSVSQ